MATVPSAEQAAIVGAVAAGDSVVVHACAGSGKTALAIMISRDALCAVTLIVYNKQLQLESQGRAERAGVTNLTCRTLHSLAGGCVDDDALRRAVDSWDAGALPPAGATTGLLIVDEAQDMRPLYIRALRHLAGGERAHPVVVLGDGRQCIYNFTSLPQDLRADGALLRSPERCWPRLRWRHMTLSTSYRLTPQMVRFVNAFWGSGMRSARGRGAPVCYVHDDPYGSAVTSLIADRIRKYGADGVMLLARSARAGRATPILVQANKLLGALPQVCFRTARTQGADARQSFTVSTFHGSKGTEARCVIVFGLDVYGAAPPDTNAMGVALSRASEELVVIHGTTSRGPLPFHPLASGGCAREHVARLAACGDAELPRGLPALGDCAATGQVSKIALAADMARGVTCGDVDGALREASCTAAHTAAHELADSAAPAMHGVPLGRIAAIALRMRLEYSTTGGCATVERRLNHWLPLDNVVRPQLRVMRRVYEQLRRSAAWPAFLYLASTCDAFDNYHNELVLLGTQPEGYEAVAAALPWLDAALDRARSYVDASASFNATVETAFDPPQRSVGGATLLTGLRGRYDVEHAAPLGISILDVKCQAALKPAHRARTLACAAMRALQRSVPVCATLLNARTGEAEHWTVSPQAARTIVRWARRVCSATVP